MVTVWNTHHLTHTHTTVEWDIDMTHDLLSGLLLEAEEASRVLSLQDRDGFLKTD